MAYQVLLSR